MHTIIRKFEKRFHIRVLALEHAILFHLFGRRPATSLQLLNVRGYSRTRFLAALRSLGEHGLVEGAIHESVTTRPEVSDARPWRYDLDPSSAKFMDECASCFCNGSRPVW